jgi:hypothetical protein
MKQRIHLRATKLPEKANAAMPLRYWLRQEQWAELDPGLQTLYVLDGEDYRLKPSSSELRQQKLAVIILAALVIIFTAIGIYGTIADKWTLQILAYCGAMPTLFGLLAQLAMYFSA